MRALAVSTRVARFTLAAAHLTRKMSAASTVNRVTANSKEELDAAIAANASKSKTFVLFTGAVDPATGKSWCPDCVDAYPTIHASIDKAEPPVTLITVPLVRAEYRGNASHWARVSYKLERIPTLMKWGKTKAVGALIEDQCKDAAAVEDLVLGDE